MQTRSHFFLEPESVFALHWSELWVVKYGFFTSSLFHQTTDKTEYWSDTGLSWTATRLSAGISVGTRGDRLRLVLNVWSLV